MKQAIFLLLTYLQLNASTAMLDTIGNLKQVMNRNASLVLQSYAQDTTAVTTIQTDSILVWLKRSDTYAGDLELANLYFFLNKLGKFDTLWAGIATAHSLVGDDLDELDELGLVYDLLRPAIEEEENIAQLAQPILDSLAFWQGWCSEPGFLAKSVLWWNGIPTVQDCGDPQKTTERANYFSKPEKKKSSGSNIIVYPNPADHTINIVFRQKIGQAFVSLLDAQGKLHKSQQLSVDNDDISQIFVQDLPVGMYILKVETDLQAPHFSQLVIIH